MYRLVLLAVVLSSLLVTSKAAVLSQGKHVSMARAAPGAEGLASEDAAEHKAAASPSASPSASITSWPSPTASSSATGSPYSEDGAAAAADVISDSVTSTAHLSRSRQLLSPVAGAADNGECSDRVVALTAAVASAEEELAAARRLIQRLEADLSESREASLLWPTPEKLATQLQGASEALDACRASSADDARALSALSMELSVCHAMAVQAAVIEESWPLSWPFACLLWRALAGTAAFAAALGVGIVVRQWSKLRSGKLAAGSTAPSSPVESAPACPFPV